jgi:hypothetical protein
MESSIMAASEHIPDNFNVDSLLEPTPETLATFNDTCLRLDELGTLDHPEADPLTGEIPDFYTVQSVSLPFNNGTTISSFSFHGSDELVSEWGMTMSIHNINLKTTDGSEYDYTAEANGTVKLFIKKPGERVPTEPHLDIASWFEATPEIMKVISASIAERRQADQLGLSKPTELSLKEFVTVIREALASGIDFDEELSEPL